ncbi:hypothetical protein JOB18_041714 [Solea senegalensis]|uniref:Uncharacterized protein n=1 Tax=Solea senegalensis TaxID=28829 RepID=A0AAV6S3J2_SOLSE|nr:hypothetical protein JOB18_041714 [Solea senegalensis]
MPFKYLQSTASTGDPVNTDLAADVRAAVGAPVSLPKQLCHQRRGVSPPMMDDSDKFRRSAPLHGLHGKSNRKQQFHRELKHVDVCILSRLALVTILHDSLVFGCA